MTYPKGFTRNREDPNVSYIEGEVIAHCVREIRVCVCEEPDNWTFVSHRIQEIDVFALWEAIDLETSMPINPGAPSILGIGSDKFQGRVQKAADEARFKRYAIKACENLNNK